MMVGVEDPTHLVIIPMPTKTDSLEVGGIGTMDIDHLVGGAGRRRRSVLLVTGVTELLHKI